MPTVSCYKCETVFEYPWKQVVQAFWHRYPNPSSTHVLTEDTICREVRDGKLYSRRLFSKTNPVPKWGERFCKSGTVKIIEDSILDPKKRTLVTFTRNIGFTKIMKVDEVVEYKEQTDGRTLAIRRAYISSQVFGFSRAIRLFGIERFKSNCNKAKNGFDYVLRNMFPSHITKTAGSTTAMTMATATATAASALAATTVVSLKLDTASKDHAPNVACANQAERCRKDAKATYEYMKVQASKVAQLFSINN